MEFVIGWKWNTFWIQAIIIDIYIIDICYESYFKCELAHIAAGVCDKRYFLLSNFMMAASSEIAFSVWNIWKSMEWVCYK